MEKKVYGVKVGSGLLTDLDGIINQEFMLSLCAQIVQIFRQGDAAFLVSSGAIASEPDTTMSSNLRAVIGQPNLMSLYKSFFGVFGLKCGELLITDHDLESETLRRVLLEAFERNVVLILNANDGTDDKEIKSLEKCADNDQLMLNIALKMKDVMSGVIIGFGSDGVITDQGNVLHQVLSGMMNQVLSYAQGGSPTGHGENGAYTKFEVAGALSQNGILTMLAPGDKENFVLRSIQRIHGCGDDEFGTLFSLLKTA